MSLGNTNITGSNVVFINNVNSFNNSDINSRDVSIINTSIGTNNKDIDIYSDCTINGNTNITGEVSILYSDILELKTILNINRLISININTNKYAISNDYIYFTDTINNMLNKLNIGTNEITGISTITGASGIDIYPPLNPTVALVTSTTDGWVKKVDLSNNSVIEMTQFRETVNNITGSLLAGDGSSSFQDAYSAEQYAHYPSGIAIDPEGNYALVMDQLNHRILKVELDSGSAFSRLYGPVSTLAGSNTHGFQDGTGASGWFNYPRGICIDPEGNYALVADTNNQRIRRVEIASGAVSTLAGSSMGYTDAAGESAKFIRPNDIAIDPTGTYAVVAEMDSGGRIRKIMLDDIRQVETLAGAGYVGSQDGIGISATFHYPLSIDIDPTGTYAVVVTAHYNHNGPQPPRIRKILLDTKEVSTFVESTTLAQTVHSL